MTSDSGSRLRLGLLWRVIRKEGRHLANALQSGHGFVAALGAAADRMLVKSSQGWK